MAETNRISCNEAIERLWAYIDGELAESEARSVASHLDVCKGCHPHYDLQKAFCQFLRRHAQKPVPPSLRRRVFMALLDEDRAARTGERGDQVSG